MIISVQNMKFTYEIPQDQLEYSKVYNIVQELDEAKEYMTPTLFKNFDIGTQKY